MSDIVEQRYLAWKNKVDWAKVNGHNDYEGEDVIRYVDNLKYRIRQLEAAAPAQGEREGLAVMCEALANKWDVLVDENMEADNHARASVYRSCARELRHEIAQAATHPEEMEPIVWAGNNPFTGRQTLDLLNENERLRIALDDVIHQVATEDNCCDSLEKAIVIANNALKGK